MKKLFVFGDVHSFYDELMTALNDAGFDYDNNDHIIVSLGDLFDRGRKSREVLKFINSFPEERKICIIGNHELLMEDLIARGVSYGHDISNGTMSTVEQITNIYGHDRSAIADMRTNESWAKYRKSWRWYYETDNCIFVHGWIPFIHSKERFTTEYYKPLPDWRNASIKQFEDATWENGMEAWSRGIKEEGKTIFCGHWHTSWGHCHLHNNGVEFIEEGETRTYNEENGHWISYADFSPFIDEGIVALDACTAYSHKVNVYVIEL